MLTKGFRFGILLQFAIGPIFLYIFKTASQNGFFVAEQGVLGVTLIDGLYILAAILGIGTIIDKSNIKQVLKILGSIILLFFGLSIILSIFNVTLIPSLNIQGASSTNNTFLYTLILTASNPLTILFWAGLFSTKLLEENLKQKDLYVFGIGALLSTLSFLTVVALLGSLLNVFLTPLMVTILNFIVGSVLIYFAIKLLLPKK